MPIIGVQDWVPDTADLGNPGVVTALNVLPGLRTYQPMPSFTVLTGALTARCRGAIDVRDKNLNVYQYAGDATKLYELSSTTWGDVSKGGGYSTGTDEVWEFIKWKNKILACNFTNDPQSIELGGTAFADMVTSFTCRCLAVVGNHVIAANINDDTDGLVPDRIQWSAFNDETDWVVDPSTGADFQDLKGEPILKVWGGEYAVILTTKATYRMDYVGAPVWFEPRETIPGIGTIAKGASARIGSTVYTLADGGFYAITNGTGVSPIGAGRVNDFIQADLDDSYLPRMTAVSDPRTSRVFWSYPGAGNTDGLPNRIIVYDAKLDKWSLINQEAEILWRAGGVGFTMEQLDSFSSSLDDLAVSLDSSQWKGGGASIVAMFDSAHKHGFFDGENMTGTIETKETEIHAGRNTHLNAFYPLVDGGTVTAEVGYRDRQSDTVNYTSSLSQSASGRFTQRVNARFHRFKLTLSGAWNHVMGVMVDQADAKVGERRA